jgi:hypothetical protein
VARSCADAALCPLGALVLGWLLDRLGFKWVTAGSGVALAIRLAWRLSVITRRRSRVPAPVQRRLSAPHTAWSATDLELPVSCWPADLDQRESECSHWPWHGASLVQRMFGGPAWSSTVMMADERVP